MEGSWLKRKWNNEHFLQVENKDYSLIVNPIINIEIGKERNSRNTTWTNTRGIMADGKLGKRFSFYLLNYS